MREVEGVCGGEAVRLDLTKTEREKERKRDADTRILCVDTPTLVAYCTHT